MNVSYYCLIYIINIAIFMTAPTCPCWITNIFIAVQSVIFDTFAVAAQPIT